MRLDIQSNHVKISEDSLEKLREKVKGLEKYYEQIFDVVVYLKEEVDKKTVELKIQVKDNTLFISEKDNTFQEAIDIAMDIAKKQLKKYKETH